MSQTVLLFQPSSVNAHFACNSKNIILPAIRAQSTHWLNFVHCVCCVPALMMTAVIQSKLMAIYILWGLHVKLSNCWVLLLNFVEIGMRIKCNTHVGYQTFPRQLVNTAAGQVHARQTIIMFIMRNYTLSDPECKNSTQSHNLSDLYQRLMI